MPKRTLISVTDKTNIEKFAQSLADLGFEIISTGGTAAFLREHGIKVVDVSAITNFPECLDGRVKTLHPKIHGGILAKRDDKSHVNQLCELEIDTIDVVAVNLYAFEKTALNPNSTFEDCVENIDIGGPAMLRSSAKNFKDVVVAIDPTDYDLIIDELRNGGDVSYDLRLKLSQKVFAHTANYDALIAQYLAKDFEKSNEYADTLTLTYKKAQDLRYGENPHQTACFYKEITPHSASIADAKQLGGKELSFNNINDLNAAIAAVSEFCGDKAACVAVKHANPCGIALGETALDAHKKAHDCDPISIFGGIVAFNKPVDENCAAEMVKIFLEVIAAPKFSEKALEILKSKPNLRILEMKNIEKSVKSNNFDIKKVAGGILVQNLDNSEINPAKFNVVTATKPDSRDINELTFAIKCVKHVKSNAIVLTKDFATIGIGVGQTNRVGALKIAIEQAGEKSNGAYLGSDAFFPFDDCVELAKSAGIKAIIQPGGSMRDEDSIKKCDEHDISMIFTGNRHFKH